jgi:thiamine-monophosphate kinase
MKDSEFELIHKLQKRFLPRIKGVVGIGDDCAIIDNNILITTDALVDNVHFLSSKICFTDLGYKAMAVNVSDICAMGGFPLYALVTVGIPSGFDDLKVQNLIDGFDECRNDYGFDILGGDTVKSDTFFVSITIIGSAFYKPLRRNTAKAKDFIYVTGRIGDSGIGLKIITGDMKYPVADTEYFLKRHYRPQPNPSLIEYLVKHHNISACIDISDGFIGDLMHIAEDSNVGFFIDIDELPVSKTQIGKSFYKDERYFYETALNGGEDYELIFTTPEDLDTMKIYEQTGSVITPVGYCEKDGFDIRLYDKKIELNEIFKSYRHF